MGSALQLDVDLGPLAAIVFAAFSLVRPAVPPSLPEATIEDDFDATVSGEALSEVGIEVGMMTRNDEERTAHSSLALAAGATVLRSESLDGLLLCRKA